MKKCSQVKYSEKDFPSSPTGVEPMTLQNTGWNALTTDLLYIFIFLIYSFAFFTFYGYIMNSQCDQLPDGLIAQLSTAPVSQRAWVQIPFRPKFVSGFNFITAQVVSITAIINQKFKNCIVKTCSYSL